MASIRLPVLLYHIVAPRFDEDWRSLTVLPWAFARQITMLRSAGYTGISASEWLDYLGGGDNVPRKPVLITFDDAYAAIAEHALPVLARAGWRATVFVPTALVGAEIRRPRPHDRVGMPVMDRRTIRHWADKGIEFGSHSRTHPDLTALTTADLENEIAHSRTELEQIVGRDVRVFAYPYGQTSEPVIRAVRKSYDAAFTVEPGINDRQTDCYTIHRSMVQHSDSSVEVWLRVAAGWNPVDSIKSTTSKWRARATV